jgi:hypothetical protein
LVGNSIATTLAQRRQILLDNLLFDIKAHLNIINTLLRESKQFLVMYNLLLLTILKKSIIYIRDLLLIKTSDLNNFFYFNAIQLELQQMLDQILLKDLQQNLFTAVQLNVELTPILGEVVSGELAVE